MQPNLVILPCDTNKIRKKFNKYCSSQTKIALPLTVKPDQSDLEPNGSGC